MQGGACLCADTLESPVQGQCAANQSCAEAGGCAVSCPSGQELRGSVCVCLSTAEPPVDGACLEDACDPTGCPCTLEGIEAAVASGGMQIIRCEPGAPPVNTTSPLLIDKDVVLDGGGNLSVLGDGTHVVFDVSAVEAELIGITISRGDPGLRNAEGATLTLRDCVVTGNTASSTPGGGIFNAGTLSVIDSEVTENVTSTDIVGGGGIYNEETGDLTVISSLISGNVSWLGMGGGIGNDGGTLLVTESEFVDNEVRHGGGGIATLLGTTKVASSLVHGNFATGLGGGIVTFGGYTEVINSTIRDNIANQEGGGLSAACGPECVATLRVTDSVVMNNRAIGRDGGGIYGQNADLVSLRTTVSGNVATSVGGGFMLESARTVATIDSNTISENSTGAVGGGIRVVNGASLTIVNSTLYDNHAGSFGGALHLGGTASADIVSCTFSHNDAVSREGAAIQEVAALQAHSIFNNGSGTLTFSQTIIDDTCGSTVPNTTSLDDNIESPGDTCLLDGSNDRVNVDAEALALSDALADSGGATTTLMPSATSVAVDSVLGDCDQLQDQRGVDRPQGPRCDIGAVELE